MQANNSWNTIYKRERRERERQRDRETERENERIRDKKKIRLHVHRLSYTPNPVAFSIPSIQSSSFFFLAPCLSSFISLSLGSCASTINYLLTAFEDAGCQTWVAYQAHRLRFDLACLKVWAAFDTYLLFANNSKVEELEDKQRYAWGFFFSFLPP